MMKADRLGILLGLWPAAALIVLSGCTTTASKRALNKPAPKDSYSAFDPEAGEASRRKAEKVDPVKDDEDPEKAVETLIGYLQKDRPYAIPAEEQLKWWGAKQGVDKIVVSKVRPLLKHPKVEVRAPALRLTTRFGRGDSNGDLIECLADSEYGIRSTAYEALKSRTHMDFGFNANAGEVARAKAVDDWRQWWQLEHRKSSIQPPSVYENNQPVAPSVTGPDGAKRERGSEPETADEPRPAPKSKTKPAKTASKSEPRPEPKAEPKPAHTENRPQPASGLPYVDGEKKPLEYD